MHRTMVGLGKAISYSIWYYFVAMGILASGTFSFGGAGLALIMHGGHNDEWRMLTPCFGACIGACLGAALIAPAFRKRSAIIVGTIANGIAGGFGGFMTFLRIARNMEYERPMNSEMIWGIAAAGAVWTALAAAATAAATVLVVHLVAFPKKNLSSQFDG